jgi:hypothetical protein
MRDLAISVSFRRSRNPESGGKAWIPALAGMTGFFDDFLPMISVFTPAPILIGSSLG